MYFFIILFFVSLLAIILMIGRKFFLLKNTGVHHIHRNAENFLSEILDFDKIKDLTIKNSKKIIHTLIWLILRIYILSLNFINKKRKELALKIKSYLNKNNHPEIEGKKEVSKYMKVISEYRQKIKKMKNKIEEEEGINESL